MKNKTCQMCLEKPAEWVSCVDFRSNTEIEVCPECFYLLAKFMRHCYYHTGAAFMKQNKVKLDRAHEALHEEYRKGAEKRNG